MTQTSKNVLAALLIVTIIISVVGTLTALSSLTPYEDVLIAERDLSETAGKVSVYVLPPPVEPVVMTGKVTVNVATSEEGG